MPERLEKLRSTVTDLENELESLQTLDSETRTLLEEAAGEIQAALGSQDPSQLESESLSTRLRSSVEQFEADHPTLAGIVTRIVDGLGQMGI